MINETVDSQIELGLGAAFTDATIIRLEKTERSYDGIFPEATVEVYRLQYGIKPRDPSKVMLAGGASIEDGWLRETQSMGSPYLVAKRAQGASTVEYLGTVWPDSGSTLDSVYGIKYACDARAGAPVAKSPLEVSRVFAVTDPELTASQAAEQLMNLYIGSLCAAEDFANPVYRTFVVSEYENLSVKMYPVAAAPAEYAVQDWEREGESWIIEPSLRYRYTGTITSLGDGAVIPEGQWVTELYRGNRIGFLMVKTADGYSYTLRSRYFGQDGQPR
jgi:hypothetical protein